MTKTHGFAVTAALALAGTMLFTIGLWSDFHPLVR